MCVRVCVWPCYLKSDIAGQAIDQQADSLPCECYHYNYKVEEILNDVDIEHCSERNIDSNVALLSMLRAKTDRRDQEGSA